MKRILGICVALIGLSTNAWAYDYYSYESDLEHEAPVVTTQVFLGFNASKLRNFDYNGKVGGTLGVKWDFMLPKAHGTYLTAGVDWTQKGVKDRVLVLLSSDEDWGTNKIQLHYLEVPVRVGYKYTMETMGEPLGIFGEFGPYFAVGISGKNKLSVDRDGNDAREEEWSYNIFKKKHYPHDINYQRWDAGLGFRVGLEYAHHYVFSMGADWGLADLFRRSYRDDFMDDAGKELYKPKNVNFTMTIGYRF